MVRVFENVIFKVDILMLFILLVMVVNLNEILKFFVKFFSCLLVVLRFLVDVLSLVMCMWGGFLVFDVKIWKREGYCNFCIILILMMCMLNLFLKVFVMVWFVVKCENFIKGYILLKICIVEIIFWLLVGCL